MKRLNLIICLCLCAIAGANSQDLPTKKTDSIKVAVSDMDAASLKMIEGKKYKEQFKASQLALQACDSIKADYSKKETLYKSISDDLKRVNLNLEYNITDLKIIAQNEKKKNLRFGFFGFLAGTLTTVISFLAFR